MKLVICIILQSWTISLAADTCTYPKYATFPVNTIEVYQMTHIVNTTLNEATVKVDLIRNLVKLPSGTVCMYNIGTCYDPKNRQRYDWNVSKSFPEDDLMCRNLMHLYTDANDFNYTYYISTLKSDPLVRFLVAESAVSVFSLQLIKEDTFCDRSVWRTDQGELIVAVGEENFINTTYEFVDPFLQKPVITSGTSNVRRKEDIYSDMMIKCELYSHIMEYKEKTIGTQKELTLVKNAFTNMENEISNYKEEISNYKEEISGLKENINRFQNDIALKNYEFNSLKDEVYDLKIALQNTQNQINEYKKENIQLKKSFSKVENKLQLANSESVKPNKDFSETEDLDKEVEITFRNSGNTLQKENMLDLPHIVDALNNTQNCFILFPYDNLFCVLASVLYVVFSVINTIMNWFSLRLLRNKRQKCFLFYTLTQGLTTMYICKNQSLTKNKVDKWLLDID